MGLFSIRNGLGQVIYVVAASVEQAVSNAYGTLYLNRRAQIDPKRLVTGEYCVRCADDQELFVRRC